MSRVVLVSNRLPISSRRIGGKRVIKRSTGGLVAGLAPVHDERDSLWMGALDSGNYPEALLKEQRLVAIELPKETARRHYEGYSNQVLWPLFHYLVEHVSFEGADFDAYQRVNERFAEAITEIAKPDDTIWVHDYHLMLLPSMLRKSLPKARIGFFLHIPFPSSEVFRILPRNEEILQGLLGADLIGLHTYDYGRHLVSSFRRILGVDFDDGWVRAYDGKCKVGVYPLGVDAAALSKQSRLPAVIKGMELLRKQTQDRKMILCVDRMDYTKGIPLRLRAYRRLLAMEPYWEKARRTLSFGGPSRSNIQSYKDLKGKSIVQLGEINGAFGEDGIVPIDYMYRSVSPEKLAALYYLADILWVTPLRDGMNLVAKEYVGHRCDASGVVVLSEFAGAASEMGEALQYNPWDIDGTARTLQQALHMEPKEAAPRMDALRKRIHANDVNHWANRFLNGLPRRLCASLTRVQRFQRED
ncbi:MAG: trehalose-6-phosphate synthase [Myxococcota bacterium]